MVVSEQCQFGWVEEGLGGTAAIDCAKSCLLVAGHEFIHGYCEKRDLSHPISTMKKWNSDYYWLSMNIYFNFLLWETYLKSIYHLTICKCTVAGALSIEPSP